MTTIKLSGGDLGRDSLLVRCNLSDAAKPVQVDYCVGEGWTTTQWQCSNCGHRVAGLASIGMGLAADAMQVAREGFRCDWDVIPSLAIGADTDHEDARDWYLSYGWHLSTCEAGDVVMQEVEYDWLDDNDDAVVNKLQASCDALTRDEAESIVEQAREVRAMAEGVEGLLIAAVAAYEAGDYDATVAALDDAAKVESDGGDCPSSRDLRAKLICDDDA